MQRCHLIRSSLVACCVASALMLSGCSGLGLSGTKKENCAYWHKAGMVMSYWRGAGSREDTIKACKDWRNSTAAKDGDAYCTGDHIKCS